MRRGLDFNLILISLLVIFAIAPLTYPGFFQSQEGFLPALNVLDLDGSLPGLGWRPPWGSSEGLLAGDGPLPYALAEAFHLVGLNATQAVKAAYASAFLLAGLAIYGLGRRLFGPSGGLIAALAYTYLPYHLATVYLRGAFAETLAFALFPLALWALEEGLQGGSRSALAFLALLSAALLLTHAGLALLFCIALLVYVALLGPSRRDKWETIAALLCGVFLGALLYLPSLWGQGSPIVNAFSPAFLRPYELLSPLWGSGEGGSSQVGVVALGMALLSAVLVGQKGVEGALRGRSLFFLGSALVLGGLTLGFARPLWEFTPLSWLLSHPWQLLALIGFFVSLAAGGLLALEPRLAHFPWLVALLALVILASYNYLSPRFVDLEVTRPATGTLGEEVLLLDYRLEGPLRHGATIHLTLYWQALEEMGEDYTVFVHVVDGEGKAWGQWDSQPVAGERPTTTWQRGEVAEDEYKVPIEAAGPREGYHIEVGMYLAESGERLTAGDGRTFIVLEEGR